MIDLHDHPPMTMARVAARAGWVLPVAATVFILLAVGAALEWLPWDQPIAQAVVDARTGWLNDFARWVSRFGSTPVVLTVAAAAAAASWRRCPRLAVAIIVLALARPLIEFGLKELIDRDRPEISRLVPGRGKSFPSGHPFATAASWGFLPLVVALYTRRHGVWWAVSITVWGIALAVAASRVYLGVHWPSDVIGGLVLAVLGVAGSERLIARTHGEGPCRPEDMPG